MIFNIEHIDIKYNDWLIRDYLMMRYTDKTTRVLYVAVEHLDSRYHFSTIEEAMQFIDMQNKKI